MKPHAVEMRNILRRSISQSVWVPLMAQAEDSAGTRHRPGFVRTYEGICSVAFPADTKAVAMAVPWTDTGIHDGHRPCVENDRFIGADMFSDLHKEIEGVRLVLEQRTNSIDGPRILLHHDLILGLGLIEEGDQWIAPDEGYISVIRVKRNESGRPVRVEIRAEHLRDFLCACQMGLATYSFRSREEVVADEPALGWPAVPYEKGGEHYDWVGNVIAIDESGFPYGQESFFMHVVRSETDTENDVPKLPFPSKDGTASRSHTTRARGQKVFRVSGELWRNEWLEPAAHSPRVAGDAWPERLTFITGASGEREDEKTLLQGGKWLWFRPNIVPELLSHRNSYLNWCTRDTGIITGGTQAGIHFGHNALGLINVYAKDVCFLPYWQQRLWHADNIAPDGGVSAELLLAQANGNPASTQSPEAFLPIALDRLQQAAATAIGFEIFTSHSHAAEILRNTHRFRSTSVGGLLALAKDVMRITADALDQAAVKRYLGPQASKLGSLKALELLLSRYCSADIAHQVCRPLFGINELRQADAHLPSRDLAASIVKAGVDPQQPYVTQGREVLDSCVTALWEIASHFDQRDGMNSP